MKRIDYLTGRTGGIATMAVLLTIVPSEITFAQQIEWQSAPLTARHAVAPWTGGSNVDAQAQSVQGTTIPMSTFTHVASKDGKTYSTTIVGSNPFDNSTWSGAPINAVVVPLIFNTTSGFTFDPTIGDPCDSNVSSLTRFKNSPLTNAVPLTVFNQNIGTTQFVNGFRRAEFWLTIRGSAAYQNPINFSYASSVSIPNVPLSKSLVGGSGCPFGVLATGSLQSNIETPVTGLLATLQKYAVIAPNQFVIFLVHNIGQADGTGVDLGFHGAVGKPVQTYAVVDWDTTQAFSGVADGSVASHEIAEWMDDPLGTNATPLWGKIGQVQPTLTNPTGCQSNIEVGDPLTGKLMPPIVVPSDPNKYPYHMQELAFYSFYFNGPLTPSVGASYYIYNEGTFSMNGTFLSPAAACPTPGGLAPFGGKGGVAVPGPSPSIN